MKKLFLLAAVAIGALTSCSEDGKDGKYYIRVCNVASVSSYWDNNPCVPYGLTYYTYYGPCSGTGSYSYDYDLSSGGGWYGTYSVSVNKGGSKSLFKDGANGADRYYSLNLYSSGLSTSYRGMNSTENQNGVLTEDKFLSVFDTKSDKVDAVIDMGAYTMHIIGERKKEGVVYPKHDPKFSKK